MSPTAQLESFAQDIYLIIRNREFDDIEGEDGQAYLRQVVRWANMFLDELEAEVDPDRDKQPVNWWFARQNEYPLGTATEGGASIPMPSPVARLVVEQQRYVQIKHDGTTVSYWAVVHPKDITSKTDRVTEDMCAMVGTNLVFSRAFRDTEATGDIVGDVALKIPRLTLTNVKALTLVQPSLLIKLGIAKNATLPDIVQGGLAPSYTQKFNDLLQGAIARSNQSSIAPYAARDNYSGILGL